MAEQGSVIDQIHMAVEKTAPVIDGIGEDQWSTQTLCEDFDVRALVNHMVGAAQMFRDVIEKGAASGDPASDYLGADPKAAYHAAMKAAVAAFDNGDVLGRTLNMPFGEFPGPAAAGIFMMEVFVHGADVAVATGQEEKLDQQLCAGVTEAGRAAGIDNFRVPGVFDPEVKAPAGSSPHQVMLGYFGRKVG